MLALDSQLSKLRFLIDNKWIAGIVNSPILTMTCSTQPYSIRLDFDKQPILKIINDETDEILFEKIVTNYKLLSAEKIISLTKQELSKFTNEDVKDIVFAPNPKIS